MTDKPKISAQDKRQANQAVAGIVARFGDEAFTDEDFEAEPVQLLAAWLLRNTISLPLYRAGNRFHNMVQSMHAPAVSAMPLVKLRVDCSLKAGFFLQGSGSDGARNMVLEALDWLGGPDSGTASLLYHVIGLEWPIRRWCKAVGVDVDPRFASGMLVSALEILSVRPVKLARDKKVLTRRGTKK